MDNIGQISANFGQRRAKFGVDHFLGLLRPNWANLDIHFMRLGDAREPQSAFSLTSAPVAPMFVHIRTRSEGNSGLGLWGSSIGSTRNGVETRPRIRPNSAKPCQESTKLSLDLAKCNQRLHGIDQLWPGFYQFPPNFVSDIDHMWPDIAQYRPNLAQNRQLRPGFDQSWSDCLGLDQICLKVGRNLASLAAGV